MTRVEYQHYLFNKIPLPTRVVSETVVLPGKVTPLWLGYRPSEVSNRKMHVALHVHKSGALTLMSSLNKINGNNPGMVERNFVLEDGNTMWLRRGKFTSTRVSAL